jgi:hypothetical protein
MVYVKLNKAKLQPAMKKTIIILSFLVFSTKFLSAQYSRDMEYKNHVTTGIFVVNTGSGHGPEMCVNVGLQKARKSFVGGILYQLNDNKISGIDIRYRIYLGNIDDGFYFARNFKPYIQYNLIFHKVSVDSSSVLLHTGTSNIEVTDSESGTIATMEHYISTGIQCRLYGRVYINTSIGFGLYLGSLDKVNHPDTPGIHRENHGFTGVVKIGLGYRIN